MTIHILQRTIALFLFAMVSVVSTSWAVGADRPGVDADASMGKIEIREEGIQINGGTMGLFTLPFPALEDSKQQVVHKLIQKQLRPGQATIQYEGGASLEIVATDAGEITFAFTNIPDEVKSFGGTMILSSNFGNGGTWRVDGGPETLFPSEKPAKPHLFQQQARELAVKSVDGKTFSIKTPQYTFQQLADNREWNWNVFAWQYSTPLDKEHKSALLSVKVVASAAGQPAQRVILVDALGQNARVDFPEKIKSVDELKAEAESEKAYYASLNPPARDSYGGMPGSGEKLALQKTGFFHVEQKGEEWHMVDPEGNLFYALGVCTYQPVDDYTYIAGRESIYAWLPPATGEFATAFRKDEQPGTVFSFHLANLIRKYGKPYEPEDYHRRMFARLRQWGMNCVGPFSTPSQVNQEMNVPYFAFLPYGKWPGLPTIPGVRETWDPFDPQNVDRLRKSFATDLPTRKNDPLLIGYYLVNEPQYEALPKVLPQLDGTKYPCKQKFVDALQAKYKTIEVFNAAWNMSAKSFESLVSIGLSVTTPQAESDLADFIDVFFETYYQLIFESFKQHDPNHMLLGNRFQPVTINNQRLMKIAGKYLDVMSFNYYTDAVDVEFLKKIHTWSGRPLLLSEWFYDSPGDSGLRGFKAVSSQEERGLAYRNYVEQTAATGYVLGATWFNLVDQAQTGRWFEKYDGESSNTGLIAVTDRPWKALLGHAMQTNYTIYELLLSERPPFAWNDPRWVPKGQ